MTLLSLLIASVIVLAVYLDCRRDAREVAMDRERGSRIVMKRALEERA